MPNIGRGKDETSVLPSSPRAHEAPRCPFAEGTIERWAFDYVTSSDLAYKLSPPDPPRVTDSDQSPLRGLRPGRPPELRIVARAKGPKGKDALVDRRKRAHLFHTFFHHELQAAELMANALVAFPKAPRAFRVGLVRILFDEVRHMQAYADHVLALGESIGAFPVRDWFWERLGDVDGPAAFVAAMGVGFEGGNLDHVARFARSLDDVGDVEGARIVRRVGEEEIVHVRFGLTWLARFAEISEVTLDAFAAALPSPLTPSVMRGPALDRASRKRAGYTESFLDALDAYALAHPSGARSPNARPENVAVREPREQP
jgi:uncharacterized ferritin-like protein (DUF455 family)